MIRDWHDGYLCRGMNEILAIIRLIDPRAFPCEGRNIFRGKPPFTTRFRIFRSSRMESCVAQKCRHFSRRTTSVPLSWMARARHASRPSRVETALSSKRGGERRETIKSDEGRGEGEKRERKKRKKESVATIFSEREKETLKRRESRPLSHGNMRSIAFFKHGSKPALPPPPYFRASLSFDCITFLLLIIIVEIKKNLNSQRGGVRNPPLLFTCQDLFINSSSAPLPSRVISIPIQGISFTV